jgi:hypothetical protein
MLAAVLTPRTWQRTIKKTHPSSEGDDHGRRFNLFGDIGDYHRVTRGNRGNRGLSKQPAPHERVAMVGTLNAAALAGHKACLARPGLG